MAFVSSRKRTAARSSLMWHQNSCYLITSFSQETSRRLGIHLNKINSISNHDTCACRLSCRTSLLACWTDCDSPWSWCWVWLDRLSGILGGSSDESRRSVWRSKICFLRCAISFCVRSFIPLLTRAEWTREDRPASWRSIVSMRSLKNVMIQFQTKND